jgi:tetratricopeptide (TPR) repeat protein
MVCLAPVAGRGEDVVHVAVGDAVRARTKLTGEVIDYTGETLLIRLPGGNERAFPAERVFLIETPRTPEQTRGEKLASQRQFEAALAEYRAALDKEQRRWVRREIIARLAECHRELGQWMDAGQYFLLLLESDPATPYFDVFPLSWDAAATTGPLRAAAEGWLGRNESAAQLLGASHLLSSDRHEAALTKLKTLSYDRDLRVAWLARAQVWRVGSASANELQVRSWADEVEKAPEKLRAGGYLVLGRAWSQRHQPARSALALMHVPILYPEHRAMSAAALYEAGLELEKIGQKVQAASLYRELQDRYPGTTQAADAARRLAEQQPQQSGEQQ